MSYSRSADGDLFALVRNFYCVTGFICSFSRIVSLVVQCQGFFHAPGRVVERPEPDTSVRHLHYTSGISKSEIAPYLGMVYTFLILQETREEAIWFILPLRFTCVVRSVPRVSIAIMALRQGSCSMASTDRGALVGLYMATSGARWSRNGNWNTDAGLSTWDGVNVNDQGRVTKLKLERNHVAGGPALLLGNGLLACGMFACPSA